MSNYNEAEDSLGRVWRSTNAGKDLTVDQQLMYAMVEALLSISQELSGIKYEGINPEFNPE